MTLTPTYTSKYKIDYWWLMPNGYLAHKCNIQKNYCITQTENTKEYLDWLIETDAVTRVTVGRKNATLANLY